MTSTAEEIETAQRAASRLLGGRDQALTRIGGGRNSRVYLAEGPGGSRFALKLYFQHGKDPRDRRAAEFGGLRFLWKNNIRCIPEPLATDESRAASLFAYIEGAPALSEQATEADIDSLADFLIELRNLVKRPGAEKLAAASEAVFSLDALAESICHRYLRLREVKGNSETYALLDVFLKQEFEPALAELVKWSAQLLTQRGLSHSSELPIEARTLSPSDFGFHNALRTPGGLVFVDFEYFGWDDPAKMISDFLLHPGMALAQPLRGRFLRRILQATDFAHALDARAKIGYVMYGLKWCMILLNEFVPEHLQRRRFANPDLCPAELQRQQLAKARTMLSHALAARAAFPYEEWIKP